MNMGGHSGKAVAAHTPIVTMGGHAFAVSVAQRKIIERAIREGGATYVRGPEVRTARSLTLLGDLQDDGNMLNDRGRVDGERWTFTVKNGVALA
jgi:hypothetical protein